MSGLTVLSVHGHEAINQALLSLPGARAGEVQWRHFPDGESYLRVLSPVRGHDVVILCGLEHPDPRFLPLSFLVSTLREMGAARVGLVAPYLAYMRQDKRFQEGEGVTSRYFARLLSQQFDFIATVDPHLHRYHALSDIYSIPSRVEHAASLLAGFVRDQANGFLVGPDEESEQWVSDMAGRAGRPRGGGRKVRSGDRQVQVTLPDLTHLAGRQPILMDDVISSGMTMARALEALAEQGFNASICAGIHGLFADTADQMLEQLGAQLVTTNTISHRSNQLDAGPMLARAVAELLEGV